MLLQTLQTLFARDIDKLYKEIGSYHDENKLWVIDKNILNSGGNLCLHLVGNLNTYIGAILGNSGYVRDRDLEFSQKNIPKAELLKKIADTKTVVETTLGKMSATQLDEEYPSKVFDYNMTTEYFLVHLAMHLDYHLGQINYHRRLLDA
jgi:uncharacterized damage-inducible protein DinB